MPNDRFAHLVKDATRSFQRSLQMRLARFDVPFGHWTFLRALWERDGLTQKQLSDEVGVMEPTTLMAVRAMEARGWVQRRRRADNRKNVHVYPDRRRARAQDDAGATGGGGQRHGCQRPDGRRDRSRPSRAVDDDYQPGRGCHGPGIGRTSKVALVWQECSRVSSSTEAGRSAWRQTIETSPTGSLVPERGSNPYTPLMQESGGF